MEQYQNPIYDGYFADPFVLLHDDTCYAYGTGQASPIGWQFPVLQSADLVHWEVQGWALEPVSGALEYWAPEVAFSEGKFYLYYSARGIDGKDHQLRVAIADHPLGPFVDCGLVLTPDDPFTIDAHPFRDVDGQWYLYYSRDFLTLDAPYRVGTGIVVDRLLDMQHLAGQPVVVVRPHQDWQVFQLQRNIYDAVYDWHTIEGAAIRLHNGRYHCFYSGGAWEQDNYGVAYVVGDHPLGPFTSPTDLTQPLLRSVAGHVIGPGHNSFVTTPAGQEWIVYHAWDVARTARRMCIDRLTWANYVPVIHAPTFTPQPPPEIRPISTT